MRGDGDLAGSLEHDIEEACGESTRTFDTSDVPVYISLEGENRIAVNRHSFVSEVDDHDLAGVLGQKEVAGTSSRHKLDALAGQSLLKEAAKTPALVLKAYLALVGDHRAELRLNSVVLQPHLQKRRVLQREPADRGLLPGTARGSSRSPLYLLVGCTIGYHPDSRLQPDSRLIRWLSTLAVAPIT